MSWPKVLMSSYSHVCLGGGDIYLRCILQTLKTSPGSLLQLFSASTEVFHLLFPALSLKSLPQLLFPLPHGLQITMETSTLP